MTPQQIQNECDGTGLTCGDGVAVKLMAELRKAMEKHERTEENEMKELKMMIAENRNDSERRHAELSGRFDAMQQSTSALLFENNHTTAEIHKLFKAAFPEGDAQAHRKAHERWMEKDKEEREFWLKIKTDAVKFTIISILGWAGLALWAAFLKGPGA